MLRMSGNKYVFVLNMLSRLPADHDTTNKNGCNEDGKSAVNHIEIGSEFNYFQSRRTNGSKLSTRKQYFLQALIAAVFNFYKKYC